MMRATERVPEVNTREGGCESPACAMDAEDCREAIPGADRDDFKEVTVTELPPLYVAKLTCPR